MKRRFSPTVSVIIPTHNHSHYLSEAVNSVLSQTYQDFEIIIVDDGSTDNTKEIVDQITDERIYYVYQENRGLAGARNTGLEKATGEYVAFLDADDTFLPCKLEVQTGYLSKNSSYGLVAGGWDFIDEEGDIIGGFNPWPNPPELSIENWLYSCRVSVHSVLVSRRWVEKVGGFDKNLRQVEDWDLWLRLAYSGCKMGWVEETVCCYRFPPGQMTRNPTIQKDASVQVINKFYNQPDLPQHLERIKKEVYARLYIRSAAAEYGIKKEEDARDSLNKAISYYPELLTSRDRVYIRKLFSWEDLPYSSIPPIDYRRYIFDHLPDVAVALLHNKRWAMGEAGLKTFYSAYHSQDWRLVWRAAIVIARYEPQNMLTKGFWSILKQSVLHGKTSS